MNGKQRGFLKRHLKELKKFAPDIYKHFYAHLSLEEAYDSIMQTGGTPDGFEPGDKVMLLHKNPDGSLAEIGTTTIPGRWENN
jgi:hypothetical protein